MAQKKERTSMWRRYGVTARSVLIWAGTYLILFTLISAGITPQRVDLRVGSPAPVTIMATKDVEDLVTTQQLQDEAAAAVETSYKSVDSDVLNSVLRNYDAIVTSLKSLRSKAGGEVNSELLSAVNALFATPVINANQLQNFLEADDVTVQQLFDTARMQISEALDSSLPEGSEQAAVSRINRELKDDEFDDGLVALATAMVSETIQPNMLIDEEITEANRQKARDAVETQVRVKGEVIVREGDIVTRSQYQMVSSLGLISENGYDFWLIGGVALLVLVLFGGIIAYIYVFERPLLSDMKTLLLMALINVLVVCLSLLLRQISVYFMPVSLGVFLITQLIKPRLALIINISQAVMVSLLASTGNSMFTMAMFSVIMSSVVSSSIVVAVMRRKQARTNTLIAGVLIAAVNIATTFAIGFISSTSLNTVTYNALWSGASGLLSAVLCIGIQPLLEWMFNLVTTSKLMELSSPNQPLLRRLMIEAPGTYHHSMVVANLAEAACSAVGANALLARVGAYYHDVGKLMRPMYFTENQRGDNPHDRTDPKVSTAILTAHTREGVQLAKKAHLPGAIQDIITQHHGTTPTLFFYAKAQKQYGEDAVDIADFRYGGPKPQTKEAAIVMLADTLEAASRSMSNPSRDKLYALIQKLVRGKLDDGQLDECPLTIRELSICTEAFLNAMSGAFHQRIEYPEVKLPPREAPKEAEAAKPAEPQKEKPAEPQKDKPAEAQKEKPAEPPKAKPTEPQKEKPVAEAAKVVEMPKEKEPVEVMREGQKEEKQ